jgi:hypothetical protein
VPETDGGGNDGGGGVVVGCPDDELYFRDKIWPTLSVQCIGCHNADGLAKSTRMVLARAADGSAARQNFETVRKMALEKQGSTSILVLRPSGKFPSGHPGGTLFAEGSATYADFAAFAERVASDGSRCDNDAGTRACGPDANRLGPRQLRRLTRLEYDNTIRDLFQIESVWGASFPPDDVVEGFDGNAAALRVGPLLVDKYAVAADEIATAAARDLTKLAPCAASGDDACATTIISDVGGRIFRRPLSTGEIARYQSLYKIGAAGGFAEGVKLVLAAMLQSPTFLYRSELGVRQSDGTYALTPYEIASELSYLFWATMPDAELWAAARDGSLTGAGAITAQAKRLLASPRSRAMLDHFAAQWLDIDRLAQAVKDELAYPGFTPALRAAMRAETLGFFDFVVRGGGKLPELFNAPYSFVNDDLAAFYGVAAPPPDDAGGGALRKVSVAAAHRGGLLTHGSILATQAKPTIASPVHRGKLVRERLLCQKPSPPPPGLNAQLPPVDPKLSNRERFTAHAKNEPCASCHRLLDPIGFAFEAFDGIGKYVGGADTRGQIVDTPRTDATFDGPLELGQLLAASADVERCFSLEWFRFASGLQENQDLACLVDDVARSFQESAASLPDLFTGLTQTAHFRFRRGAEDGATSLPGIDGGGVTPPPPPSDAGAPRDAGPPATPDLTVTRKTDSQWDKGYCDAVTVTNKGMSGIDWAIVLTIEGTINQVWNAVATGATGSVTFRGVDFNRRLEPGQSSSFGFCAAR